MSRSSAHWSVSQLYVMALVLVGSAANSSLVAAGDPAPASSPKIASRGRIAQPVNRQAGPPSELRLVPPAPLPGGGDAEAPRPEETPPGKPLGPASSIDTSDPGIQPITSVSVNTSLPAGSEGPTSLAAPLFAKAGVVLPPADESRNWVEMEESWVASGYCHQPLYFEEINVERYGIRYRYGLQPFVSCAHFFATIPLLPYKMVVNPPCECQYTLGYFRPGNPAIRQRQEFELRADAGAAETGAVIGMILLLK